MSDLQIRLKQVMQTHRLRDVDVASRLKISDETVRRFKNGHQVRPNIEHAFLQLVEELSPTKKSEPDPAA